MLIEPTESESLHTLDQFVGTMRELMEDAKAGNIERFKNAPMKAPMRRLDETQAARSPHLRWEEPEEGAAQAAE
jgi:glycine dehydrogenase subunit 2